MIHDFMNPHKISANSDHKQKSFIPKKQSACLLFETIKNLIFWIATRVSTRDYVIFNFTSLCKKSLKFLFCFFVFVFWTDCHKNQKSKSIKDWKWTVSDRTFFIVQPICNLNCKAVLWLVEKCSLIYYL